MCSRRQAIVNKGLVFTLKVETPEGFTSQDFLYQDGITDYVKEVLGDQGFNGGAVLGNRAHRPGPGGTRRITG